MNSTFEVPKRRKAWKDLCKELHDDFKEMDDEEKDEYDVTRNMETAVPEEEDFRPEMAQSEATNQVEDNEVNNTISITERISCSKPCSSTPKITQGRKRKRKNYLEEALHNVLNNVTKQFLDFEQRVEDKAEEKREAFREKLLQQNKEMLELLRKSILDNKICRP